MGAGLLWGAAAWAHPLQDAGPPRLATALELEPLLVAPLLAALALYGLGLRRLWRRGAGTGLPAARAAAFVAGWVVLALALLSPLDAFGAWSLAAHMTQHMLLAAVVPPLLLLGLPGAVWLAALPPRGARGFMQPLRRLGARAAWQALAAPTAALALQTAVMWGWHLPAAMQAALHDGVLHAAMHASFLAAGLLFWAALLRSVREPVAGAGAAAIAIVGTMIQMGLLGALLTFAGRPRYPYYAERAPQLGLSALEDQQLAGLIMWVPAAVPYLLGGLALAAAWLRRSEQRAAPVPSRRQRR